MSGGRGRAGGGGGGNPSSRASSTSASAKRRQNRAPSPSPSRWPAGAAVSTSSFGELWGAMNAVAAATGIKKKAEREGREAMSTSATSMLKPATRTATKQAQPQPLLLPLGGTIRAHVPSRRPVLARAAAAVAAAAAASPSLPPPPLLPEEIAARLDSAPALSALDLFVALLASALAFSLTSALTHLRREGASRAATAAAGAAAAGVKSLPFSLSLTPLPLLAALAAFALALLAARERAFASRAFSARELADEDSRFARLLGVEVHYKVARPSAAAAAASGGGAATGGGSGGGERGPAAGRVRFSIAAMHGFGAAAFSWSLVARPLADLLSASFTKHDMPGFGLTERPSNLGLAPYSLAFNGRLARAVADLELERARGKAEEEETAAGGPAAASAAPPPPPPLRVLMGHSLGAVCAAAEAARDPEGVDALILVAPAIVAGGGKRRKKARRGGAEGTSGGESAATEKPTKKPPTFSTLPMRLLSAASAFAASLASLLAGWATRALIVLSWPFLVFLLRAAVRSFQFWENGLSAALGGREGGGGSGSSGSSGGGGGSRSGGGLASSPEEEDEAGTKTPAGIPLWLSQRYRLPSLVRGWETGFLLFLLARVPVPSGGPLAALARAAGDARSVLLRGKGRGGRDSPSSSSSSSSPLTSGPPAARLAAAVRGAGVPLLVIHGDRDALVPLGNSARLVEQLNDASDSDGGDDYSPSAASSPLCELVVLRNRGHTPQEEAPREFVEAVAAFLERVEREKKKK